MITINRIKESFTISPKDMVEGHAYMDKDGDIYICCPVEEGGRGVVAFSICGRFLVDAELNKTKLYSEVDLEITVK